MFQSSRFLHLRSPPPSLPQPEEDAFMRRRINYRHIVTLSSSFSNVLPSNLRNAVSIHALPSILGGCIRIFAVERERTNAEEDELGRWPRLEYSYRRRRCEAN